MNILYSIIPFNILLKPFCLHYPDLSRRSASQSLPRRNSCRGCIPKSQCHHVPSVFSDSQPFLPPFDWSKNGWFHRTFGHQGSLRPLLSLLSLQLGGCVRLRPMPTGFSSKPKPWRAIISLFESLPGHAKISSPGRTSKNNGYQYGQ